MIPVRAFRESRDAFARGDWPILTLSTGSELSQDGHAVIPYMWDPPTEAAINSQPMSGQTWKIYVANPNVPIGSNDNPSCLITIDPSNQVFTYKHTDGSTWTGTNSSGGRLLSISFSQLNYEPVTLGEAVFALIAGGTVIFMSGDGQTSQITDEAGRTFYASQPLKAEPVASKAELAVGKAELAGSRTELAAGKAELAVSRVASMPSTVVARQARMVNPDAKTRIPDMIAAPLTHLSSRSNTGRVNNNVVSTIHSIAGTEVGQNLPANLNPDNQAEGPFELYYVKRPTPAVKWPQPLAAGIHSAPVHDIVVAASHPASQTSVTAVAHDKQVTALSSSVAPAASTSQHSIPVHLLNSQLLQSALTFQTKGQQTGSYVWSAFSPCMAVTISTPTVTDAIDTVTLGEPGAAAQTFSFQPDQNAQARQFTVNVAGWRGDQNPQIRSYVLDNLTVTPGQSLVMSINDGGKELWLNNAGSAVTCNLTIYAGIEAQSAISRPNITLEAGALSRIRPGNWDAGTMSQASIAMHVFNNNGTLLRQVNL